MPVLLRPGTDGHADRLTDRRTDTRRDVTAVCALGVLGATAVGWRWAGRPAPVRAITMGPGGWVSFKGVAAGRGHRPWWAHVLRAQPLRGVTRSSTRRVRGPWRRP